MKIQIVPSKQRNEEIVEMFEWEIVTLIIFVNNSKLIIFVNNII